MVLEITQDSFNNAVQENIEILGLDEEEAIEEAVKQFEAQVTFDKPGTKISVDKNNFRA